GAGGESRGRAGTTARTTSSSTSLHPDRSTSLHPLPIHRPTRKAMTQMTTPARHVPVLAQRCLDLLAPAVQADGAVLIDATLGLGGHAEAALHRFDQLHLVGIDRDLQALALATERLAPFGDRFTPVHARYDEIGAVAAEHGHHGRVHGILFDLGVSSLQLDEVG